jgi:NADPH-dependent 2,4-dienoyl-CoA reductase/sulfur reductase-like enzyme
VLGPRLGSWFAELHRAEGVEVLLSAGVTGVRGRNRATELELAGGRRVRCDRVVVGVGVRPATRWLAGSGLELDGVCVDGETRSSAPGVYAAGDAAQVWDPGLARHLRTEHWEAAARQGAAAARAMLGLEQAPAPPPSFWSDQYGIRVQYVGHGAEADRIVLDGDPDSRDFQAEFTRDGATVAALLVGRPRALPAARRRVHDALQQHTQATTTTTR